jgi:hypothetical protein
MGRAPKSQHAQLARISHAAVGSLQHPATPHTESLPPWQTWMSQGASSQASGQLLQSPCGHGPTPESGNTRTAVGQASTATRRNSTIPSAAYRATRQPSSTSPQWQCPGCHDAHPSRAPPPCSAPATSGRFRPQALVKVPADDGDGHLPEQDVATWGAPLGSVRGWGERAHVPSCDCHHDGPRPRRLHLPPAPPSRGHCQCRHCPPRCRHAQGPHRRPRHQAT